MIMKYIVGRQAYDEEKDGIVYQNNDYKKAEKDFLDFLEPLEKKVKNQIDEKATFMIAMAIDAAFDHGFDEGVRFIMGCIAGQEVSEVILRKALQHE